MDIERFLSGEELFDGHYKLIRPLSMDGATADVWLAIDVNTIDTELSEEPSEQNEETGMMVAIKIYRPKNALDVEGEQRFRDEFKIVYECRHANLLQPTSFSIFEDCPYLVLPYCQFGSSEQLIGSPFSVDDMWKFILDVASGLNRLHTNSPQIVHQDIKPANILIDNTHNYAITDFGISSARGREHGYYYGEGNSGTFAYMAPERFQEDVDAMPQSDIWAFGATLCEVFTGKVPYGEGGGSEQVKPDSALPDLQSLPAPIQRLILACLDKEPGNRPTAQQLVDAARAKQFPLKPKSNILPFLIAAVLVVAGIVIWLVKPWDKGVSETVLPTPEEEYAVALSFMDSDDPAIFMQGYNKMDSLSKLEFIPALYQMAFTHGWYSDSASLRRKQILKIKTDEKRVGYPMSDKDNILTINCLIQILSQQDSLYAEENARAAYRLAGYYLNNTDYLQKNEDKAAELANESVQWASLSGNEELEQQFREQFEKVEIKIK